jgi:hypothetical protein
MNTPLITKTPTDDQFATTRNRLKNDTKNDLYAEIERLDYIAWNLYKSLDLISKTSESKNQLDDFAQYSMRDYIEYVLERK